MVDVTNQGSQYIIVPQSTLKFGDGTLDYVTISASPYFSPGNNKDFSVSCWVMPTDWGGPKGGGWTNIFGKQEATIWGLHITTHTNPQYGFHVSGGGNNVCDGVASEATLNKWTHLTGTYDGNTKLISLYMNGDLKVTLTSASGSTADTTSHILIGNDGNYSLSGQVYDCRFWSGACLTADEVKKVYNGLDVDTSHLVAHYKFLDREGTTLEDSVNNLNGTITGADWYERKLQCWNTRWDEGNWNVTLETFLDARDRNYIFRNVTPGAIRELYNILGTPKYIDTTYTSSNTLIFEPISNYGLSSLRQRRTIGVKSISDTFIIHDKFGIKVEGMRLDI